MKHKLSKRAMLALAMCVACVLAFGATLAQAAVDSWMGGKNQLTIGVSDGGSDVKDANAQVNVYRIATGTKDSQYDTYNYTFDVDPFTELGKGYDPGTMNSDSWQAMAEAANKIVADNGTASNATAPVGEPITGLADGLYLVLIPDTTTGDYAYTFQPALVALPGKVGADGPAYNTAAGEWTDQVAAVIKWSRTERKGSLRINKNLTDFVGDDATFTYHITGTLADGTQYENFAAVHYSANGEVESFDIVGGIPAGLEVTITEINDGAQYQSVDGAERTATIVADDTVSVDFTNAPDDNSGKVGHGIENHFRSSAADDDWQLEVRAIDRESEVI